MPYIRAALFLQFMALTLLALAPFQALARRFGWGVRDAVQRGFCRIVCAILGIEIELVGQIPARRPIFVAANHLSWTDILALASLHPFVFLAKKEVSGWPVLGFLARLQGAVFLERGARRDIPEVNAALTGALCSGSDLVVFAEGTTTDGASPPRFRPVHFEAAREAAAIVLPVAIFYSDGEKRIDIGWYGDMTFLPHLWGLMKRGGARCHILVGQIVETGGKSRKELAEEAQGQVCALLQGAQGAALRAPRPSGTPADPPEAIRPRAVLRR